MTQMGSGGGHHGSSHGVGRGYASKHAGPFSFQHSPFNYARGIQTRDHHNTQTKVITLLYRTGRLIYGMCFSGVH